MRNMTDEQLQALAAETMNDSVSQIQRMAKEFGLDVVKTTLLVETARIVTTLTAFGGLLDGRADGDDDKYLRSIAENLDRIGGKVMQVAVFGLVDSKDLATVLAGPDRYCKLVEDAVHVMASRMSETIKTFKAARDEGDQGTPI